MGGNRVTVLTDFNDGQTKVEIEGTKESSNIAPAVFVISDNNPLAIELVDGNGEKLNPQYPIQVGSHTYRFYIELESPVAYKFDIRMNESGWIISRTSCFFSCNPVLVPRLPKKLNICLVRLILLPVELFLKVVRFPVECAMLIYKTFTYWAYAAENTNITVGSKEG